MNLFYSGSEKETLQVAAWLLYTLHGAHNPSKHKAGFVDDLSTILPYSDTRVQGGLQPIVRASGMELFARHKPHMCGALCAPQTPCADLVGCKTPMHGAKLSGVPVRRHTMSHPTPMVPSTACAIGCPCSLWDCGTSCIWNPRLSLAPFLPPSPPCTRARAHTHMHGCRHREKNLGGAQRVWQGVGHPSQGGICARLPTVPVVGLHRVLRQGQGGWRVCTACYT